MIDPTKKVGANPTGAIHVFLVDPYTRLPVAPLAHGRYVDPKGNSLLIQHLPFSVGDNLTDYQILAGVPNYIIAVVGYIVQSGATAQQFAFKSKGNDVGVAISHIMQNGAYGGASRPIINGGSYFQTLPGEALTAYTSSAGGDGTTGMIDYVLIPDPSIQWEAGSPLLDEHGQTIAA
jgi:hypothetical protein